MDSEAPDSLASSQENGHNGVKQNDTAEPYVLHRGSIVSGELNQPFLKKADANMPEWSNYDCDEELPCMGASAIPAKSLYAFCAESHAIEGVFDSALTELLATRTADFLDTSLTLESLCEFNDKGVLRDQAGMNLRAGFYIPTPGGPSVRVTLLNLIGDINHQSVSPYDAHCQFMALLPFMDGNGLTGRALWLYHRLLMDQGVPHKFLRNWYVDCLQLSRT